MATTKFLPDVIERAKAATTLKKPAMDALGQPISQMPAQTPNTPLPFTFGNNQPENILNQGQSLSPQVADPKLPELKSGSVIRDAEGNITGRVNDSGGIMLGLSPQEVEQMSQNDIMRKQGGQATQALEQQAAMPSQVDNSSLLGQVGQTPAANAFFATPTDWGGVTAAAVKGLIPQTVGGIASIGAGAAAGAAILGAPSFGIGAPVGAIIGGALVAISRSSINAVDSQKTETKQGQMKTLTDGKKYMTLAITQAKADPQRAADYVEIYNQWKQKIEQAQAQMKLDVKSDILKFRDNRAELIAFSNFLEGNEAGVNLYNSKMQEALMGKTPDTAALNFLMEESNNLPNQQ